MSFAVAIFSHVAMRTYRLKSLDVIQDYNALVVFFFSDKTRTLIALPYSLFFSDQNMVSSSSLPRLSDEEFEIYLIFRLSVTYFSFLFGNGAAAATMETGGIFFLRRSAQKTGEGRAARLA
ncbi:hypothetical protein MRB53_014076 [Persea americana]|uniref:Uncharacterized protein n=1 Tax=Persea americana TaxID=3435 RepID=A0ACC2K9R6_PERAE|nr:hypothetical protein MRB53_014076 [Persea americana]